MVEARFPGIEKLELYARLGMVDLMQDEMSTYSEWIVDNHDQERFEEFATLCGIVEGFKAIEAEHGPGAAINIDDERSVDLLQQFVEEDAQLMAENARKLKIFMDSEWIWASPVSQSAPSKGP